MIAVPARTRRRLLHLTGSGTAQPLVAGRPRLVAATAGLVVAGLGGLLGGPVAAVVTGTYALVGALTMLRVRGSRLRARDWTAALDALAEIAGDLRAGLTPARALADTEVRLAAVPLVRDRVRVAVRVAEATGAPLAELVERLEVDLRGLDRVRLSAAAHAAGTRATAVLLGVLPLAGIGVGYGMGADPLRVLLRTPVGAGCALGAVALQLAGLAWTVRLSRAPDGLR